MILLGDNLPGDVRRASGFPSATGFEIRRRWYTGLAIMATVSAHVRSRSDHVDPLRPSKVFDCVMAAQFDERGCLRTKNPSRAG